MTRVRTMGWAAGLMILLALSVLAGCGGGGSPASSSAACIAVGYVKEAATQDGIAGATVVIGTHSGATGSDGYYEITGLSTGLLSRTVTASGYSDYADTVTADSGVNTYPDVLMVDAPPPPP